MNRQYLAALRAKAALLCQPIRHVATRLSMKARVVLGLFLLAAVLMAIYTALTAKDASLHLRVQHDFHNAQLSVWVDGDLVYSGTITGSTKKRFGLFPTDSVEGTLLQIIPVRSGQHTVRIRIAPDDATAQDGAISGKFSRNSQRDLSVSARHSRVALAWQGTSGAEVETSSRLSWISRYAGSLLLTIAGSLISALTGFAIKELPGRFRSTTDSAPKVQLGPQ